MDQLNEIVNIINEINKEDLIKYKTTSNNKIMEFCLEQSIHDIEKALNTLKKILLKKIILS